MANKIILKKTSTASKIPLATDLEVGEIAVNLADQKLYSKNASGTVILVGDGQGTGDVVGPSSATNNAVARFNSTTGKLIKNSSVTVDDNSNVTANNLFDGFASVAASGTQITLTIASVPNYLVTGSGGQVIQLPNATTLPNGANFTFNNNQSSGAITVNNNSGTLIASIPSGGFVTVSLLSNSIAAGTWDRHDQAPSNVSWSTNTFDYSGSITSATWNGNIVAVNRGGTGTATPSLVAGTNITITGTFPNQTINSSGGGSLPSQSGNAGKYLTTDGTNASWATVSGGGATPITQNLDQVTSNQTIASGSNGFSVGPMTIASGYTVTVASGQRWVII